MIELEPDEQLIALSLGAGVQSSTMALMAAHGEITPMPDCAIFADTQAEPKHIYEWLDWLETQLPYPIYRVTAGSLTEGIQRGLKGTRVATPPFFTRGLDGRASLLMRQCTREYKVDPIRQELRKLIGLKPRQKAPKKPGC